MAKNTEVLSIIKSIPTSVKSLPIGHLNAANNSLSMLVDAYSNYKNTVQIEKTKRTAIITNLGYADPYSAQQAVTESETTSHV